MRYWEKQQPQESGHVWCTLIKVLSDPKGGSRQKMPSSPTAQTCSTWDCQLQEFVKGCQNWRIGVFVFHSLVWTWHLSSQATCRPQSLEFQRTLKAFLLVSDSALKTRKSGRYIRVFCTIYSLFLWKGDRSRHSQPFVAWPPLSVLTPLFCAASLRRSGRWAYYCYVRSDGLKHPPERWPPLLVAQVHEHGGISSSGAHGVFQDSGCEKDPEERGHVIGAVVSAGMWQQSIVTPPKPCFLSGKTEDVVQNVYVFFGAKLQGAPSLFGSFGSPEISPGTVLWHVPFLEAKFGH